MKKNFIISIVVLAGLFFGCSKDNKSAGEKPKLKASLVKVEEIRLTSISKTVRLTGTVEAKVFANVIAPVDGYIENLNVRENDDIAKDKQLAVIGTQERTSLVSQTKNKVEELQTRLNKTSSGSSAYSQLHQQLEQAKKELDYADKLFLGVPVTAPLSGTLTQKFIEAGSVVSAKQNLFTIVDFKSLIIKSSVSEDLFSKIDVGDKMKIIFNAIPEKEFSAKVTLKYQQIDPATRNFPVELKLINGAKDVSPGMMAELELITDKKEKIIAVPNDIFIVNQKGEKIVFVVKDSMAHQKIVTTDLSNESSTEITAGLNEGDNLVVMGQELLKDGMNVMVQKPKEMKKEGGKKK